jgi:hypothetical protein
MAIFDIIKDTIGIDPGSQYLRIIKDGELFFNEQSQISLDRNRSSLSGYGNSIRTTPNDVILRPINYSIIDFHAFELFTRRVLKDRLHPKKYFSTAVHHLFHHS